MTRGEALLAGWGLLTAIAVALTGWVRARKRR